MANIKSAKKRARQAGPRRARNSAQRSLYRSLIREVIRAIEAKDKDKAATAYQAMVPVLDRYANRGLIHKNKAARHKSHLNKQIKALA